MNVAAVRFCLYNLKAGIILSRSGKRT